MLLALLSGCVTVWSRYEFDHGTLEKRRTLLFEGRERRYALFTSSEPGPRPLVIHLHGGGATLAGVLADPGGASPLGPVWLETADEEGFHVVMPAGVDQHWNDCRADCETGCDETVDDSAFLAALIDEVSGSIDVDPDRIHVTGESNGGMMTQRLAREHGARLASVGVVIAAIPANNECADASAPLPVAYVVGTADRTMPWDGGEVIRSGAMRSAADTIATWHAWNGCSGEPTVAQLDDLDPDDGASVRRVEWRCTGADTVRYEVEGGGHVAPSIAEQVANGWTTLVGPQSHDIETVHELWSFFEDHPRQP